MRHELAMVTNQGDQYTHAPTHLRIYCVDEVGGRHWELDGAGDDHRYTEDFISCDTFKEIVTAIPDFIKNNGLEAGITWRWAKGRRGRIYHDEFHYTKKDTAAAQSKTDDMFGETFAEAVNRSKSDPS